MVFSTCSSSPAGSIQRNTRSSQSFAASSPLATASFRIGSSTRRTSALLWSIVTGAGSVAIRREGGSLCRVSTSSTTWAVSVPIGCPWNRNPSFLAKQERGSWPSLLEREPARLVADRVGFYASLKDEGSRNRLTLAVNHPALDFDQRPERHGDERGRCSA